MPHIQIKCYPKQLSETLFNRFIDELSQLVQHHLNATDGDVSIQYTEIAPENWAEIYRNEIQPNLERLAKKPTYTM